MAQTMLPTHSSSVHGIITASARAHRQRQASLVLKARRKRHRARSPGLSRAIRPYDAVEPRARVLDLSITVGHEVVEAHACDGAAR